MPYSINSGLQRFHEALRIFTSSLRCQAQPLEKVPAYLDLPCNSERLEELMPWSEAYREYEGSELEKEIQAFVPRSQKKPFYRPYQIREISNEKTDEAAS